MSKKEILSRLRKRAKNLKRKRETWKKGESAKVKEPQIKTKNSIRTLSGGLPGSGKR